MLFRYSCSSLCRLRRSDYNEASNRDEDWTYNSPSMVSRLLSTMSTHKCRANSRIIPTVMAP